MTTTIKQLPAQETITSHNITQYIENGPLSSAFWGVLVKDLQTDECLIEHHPKKIFIPASVTKLFTTTLALKELGATYRFVTKMYATAPIDPEGKIQGNIILQGSGDPTFSSKHLHHLVQHLKSIGVKTIAGSVFIDESHFQGTKRITHAEWEDLTWYYCPEISALAFNENAVHLHISPGSYKNQKASVEIEQCVPYLTVSADIDTVTKGTAALEIERDLNDNHVSIAGSIPIHSSFAQYKIAVHNPSEYARLSLIHELISSGIGIQNHLFEEVQERCELAAIESQPLKEILHTINKTSHTLAAELVFQETLVHAKQTKTESVLESFKKELKIDDERFLIHSGSGLSRQNCLTPYDVCSLLRYLHLSPSYSLIIDSLPIAGVDGTLKKRFTETYGRKNIKAKTGSLSGGCSLAGYATTRSGKEVCFCIFVNHFTQSIAFCHSEIDQLLLKILEEN